MVLSVQNRPNDDTMKHPVGVAGTICTPALRVWTLRVASGPKPCWTGMGHVRKGIRCHKWTPETTPKSSSGISSSSGSISISSISISMKWKISAALFRLTFISRTRRFHCRCFIFYVSTWTAAFCWNRVGTQIILKSFFFLQTLVSETTRVRGQRPSERMK